MLSANSYESPAGQIRSLYSSISTTDDLRGLQQQKQGLATLQAAAAGPRPLAGPAPYTPRKYLKVLVYVLKTLVKHHTKLSVGFLAAMKVRLCGREKGAAGQMQPQKPRTRHRLVSVSIQICLFPMHS
jgi:hypothetical protein